MKNIAITAITATLLVASVAGAKCIHEKYPTATPGTYTDTYTCKDNDATEYLQIVGKYKVESTIRIFDYQETVERVECEGNYNSSYGKWVMDSQGKTVWYNISDYPADNGYSCQRGFDELVTKFKNRWGVK